MKQFEELTREDLQELRREISLNSLYISDYENSFNFNANDVCSFFDGYVDFICELAQEDNFSNDFEKILDAYDNIDTLVEWFYCYDDLSWVRINESEDDED